MNSLDAMISITILLATSAVLLGTLTESKENISKADNQIEAIITAQKCASIIDSVYSNTATEYQKEINCTVEANITTSKINGEGKKKPDNYDRKK